MASLPRRGRKGGGKNSLLMRHRCFKRSDRYMVQFCGVMVERWLMPRIRSCMHVSTGQARSQALNREQSRTFNQFSSHMQRYCMQQCSCLGKSAN